MLNFDSLQRCETVRHLIQASPMKEHDSDGWISRQNAFPAPHYRWVLIDPADAPGDQIQGSGEALPLLTDLRCICLTDVFEHLAPENALPFSMKWYGF